MIIGGLKKSNYNYFARNSDFDVIKINGNFDITIFIFTEQKNK